MRRLLLTEPRGDPRGGQCTSPAPGGSFHPHHHHRHHRRSFIAHPLSIKLSLSLSLGDCHSPRAICRSSPPIHRALRIPLPPLALSSARDPRRSFRRPYATRAGRGEAKVDGGAPVGFRRGGGGGGGRQQLNRARSRAVVVVVGRPAGRRAFAAGAAEGGGGSWVGECAGLLLSKST